MWARPGLRSTLDAGRTSPEFVELCPRYQGKTGRCRGHPGALPQTPHQGAPLPRRTRAAHPLPPRSRTPPPSAMACRPRSHWPRSADAGPRGHLGRGERPRPVRASRLAQSFAVGLGWASALSQRSHSTRSIRRLRPGRTLLSFPTRSQWRTDDGETRASAAHSSMVRNRRCSGIAGPV